MHRAARLLGGVLVAGCATSEPIAVRPELVAAPVPSAVAVAVPAAATAVAAYCAISSGTGDEQRALAAWLAREPVPVGFSCPATMRVVQREPWYVADGELASVETDDVGGPTRRTAIGERVWFWGVDASSGDSLVVALGRLDGPELAAAQQRIVGEALKLREAEFEEEARRLGGPWHGLSFVARPAATAQKLRAWFAELPARTAIESYPIGWEQVLYEDDLSALPRLVHVRGAVTSTLCIEAAVKRGCWTTEPVEIDGAWPEPFDELGGEEDEDEDVPSDEFPPVELTVWTGRGLELWQLDAAGGWTVVGVAKQRGKSVRRRAVKSDRRFASGAVMPFRGEFPGLWVRPLGADWVAAGEFGSGSQGLVPDATWIFRRQPSGWQFGALDGDDVRAHVEWPEGPTIGLVLGSHERPGGDGLGGADGRLWAFTGEGEWLRPAGRLPLPVQGMAMWRSEGGWEYEHSLTAKPPRCLTVALKRSVYWRTDDYGAHRKNSAMRLPMASLTGDWSLGPEGLMPGC